MLNNKDDAGSLPHYWLMRYNIYKEIVLSIAIIIQYKNKNNMDYILDWFMYILLELSILIQNSVALEKTSVEQFQMSLACGHVHVEFFWLMIDGK